MVLKKQTQVTAEQKKAILDRIGRGLTKWAAIRYARVTRKQFQLLYDEDDHFAEALENATAVGELAKAKAKGQAKGKIAPALPIPEPPRRAPPPLPSVPPPIVTTGGETSWVSIWSQIRQEAAELAPGEAGQLLWVERACVRAGMHPLDRQWLWHFQEFYASKKTVDVGRFGLRAAKSDSNCRAVTAEVLLTPRRLEPGFVGVCPIMSSNMSEADDRFDTIVQVLSACGLTDLTGIRQPEAEGFQRSGGGSSARVISLRDAQGYKVEFRIYPASISGAAGFTGIAGFCDEVDLWGKEAGANPAKRVFEVLLARYATQPTAKLHVMSASYHRESEHASMIAMGDTPLQRVARLGADGATIDTEARARLAVSVGSHDPLLLTAADPMSTDIPCWVSNPVAPIESCYALAKGDIKRMMFLYGGRLNLLGGRAASMGLEDLKALGERNRQLVSGVEQRGLMLFDDLPSWDPRSRGHRNPGSGEPSI
jgi:hypothetical protein